MTPEEPFRAYRRDLPHWRAIDSVYHVVWRLHHGQPLLRPEERQLVVDALWHFHGVRYQLFAYAVMDDHVHVVVDCGESRLDTHVHSWKSFTAHALSRGPPVWQRESYDRIIRSDAELEAVIEYNLYNPIARWPELRAYAWAGSAEWEHLSAG